MKKINVVLFCLTSFLACNQSIDKNISVVDFSKHNFESIVLNIDSVAGSWKQIELETDKACLVTPYDNIYPCNNFIIIYNPNQILQFDCSGRFVKEIAHTGQGPEDINFVLQCTVNEKENLLYIAQAGKPNDIAVYDLNTQRFINSIPVAAKRMLISFDIVNDSTLICFPFMGEGKQAVYFQNLKGDIIGQSELNLEDPTGAFVHTPLKVFAFEDKWRYQGHFEDTVYDASLHKAVAVFRKGASETVNIENRDIALLNRLFHTFDKCFLSRKTYKLAPGETEGSFIMQIAEQRYFAFDWTTKTAKEINEIIFTPLHGSLKNKEMFDFFSMLTSLNSRKIVIAVPAENLGKDAELNPVLYIGNM